MGRAAAPKMGLLRRPSRINPLLQLSDPEVADHGLQLVTQARQLDT